MEQYISNIGTNIVNKPTNTIYMRVMYRRQAGLEMNNQR